MLGTPTLIVVLVLLAVFGWRGYRRGVQLEAVLTFTVVGARILVTSFGSDLARIANNLFRSFQFVLAGGLGASDQQPIFQKVQHAPPLISQPSQDTFLLIAFLIIVGLVYWLSQRIWKMATSWVGSLLGALNGFLLLNHLLPILGGKPPEASALTRAAVDGAMDLVGGTPVAALTSQSGAALLLVAIAAVLVLAALSVKGRSRQE